MARQGWGLYLAVGAGWQPPSIDAGCRLARRASVIFRGLGKRRYPPEIEARIPPGQTLQATALVHEAWLRLMGPGQQSWNGRGHFFAAAAEAMRRIQVEKARRKSAEKHGGKLQRVDLDKVDVAEETNDELVLLLDETLGELAQRDALAADLIKLRFFAGLPNAQAAELLGVPERTAKRTWAYARAWLYQQLSETAAN